MRWIHAVLSLSLIFVSSTSAAYNYTNTAQVIVVGGGVAGIAASLYLKNWYNYQVILLEASDILGGRVLTYYANDTRNPFGFPVDLGASIIYTEESSTVGNLAYTYGADQNYTTFDNATYVDANGSDLDNATISQLNSDYSDLQNYINKQKASSSSDMSLGTVIENYITSSSLSSDRIRYLYNQVTTRISIRYGDDLNNLSLSNYNEANDLSGETSNIPSGFINIFVPIVQDLETNTTVNATVYKIESYTDGSGNKMVNVSANVTYYDNETDTWVFNEPRLYTAQGVVVAVGLNVLKSNAIEFVPALSSAKQAAISKVGFGLVNRILLYWDNPFWPPVNDLFYYMSNNTGQFCEWINWETASDQSMLIGQVVGNQARALELLTDGEVIDQAMGALRAMFGNSIPNATSYLVTRWGSNPLIGGAFAYYTVGTTEADINSLAAPESDNIFFAGEHTSVDHLGTVLGAWESGARASGEFFTFPIWAIAEIVIVSVLVVIGTIITIVFFRTR